MKVTNKLSVLFVLLAILLSSLPFSAFAVATDDEDGYSLYVGGVGMNAGDYLAVDATEVQKEAPKSGGYAAFDGVFLNLYNYSYNGEGYKCKEEGSQYITYIYPTVIYSKLALKIRCFGENSLIGSSTSGTTRGIYSDGNIYLYGDGKLYVKAKRAIYAIGEVNVYNMYLDVYSDYFYGIYSNKLDVTVSRSSLKMRGAAGIHTYTYDMDVAFYTSAVDIRVENTAVHSSGNIIISDTELTAVSNSPEFFDAYSAFSFRGVINYGNSGALGSENASSSGSEMFDKASYKKYHWVYFYRYNSLKYIDIVDISKPESHCSPDYTGKADSPYTEILDIKWFLLDGEEEKEFSRFVADQKYRLKVTVFAGDTYEFDDINTSAYIGNDLVQSYCPDLNAKKRVLVIDYVASANPENFSVKIGNIALNDGDYLKKGDSSVTATKPDDYYAYYKNGVLTLHNFIDRNADIVFEEGYLEIYLSGESIISSVSDTYETDGENHDVAFYGEGLVEIFGSNSSLSRACGVNVSGVLYVVEGTVNLDADITYCIDADTVWLTGGELYCSTSQGGVFARACKIHIHGGEFHAFDGGTWGQFIYDGVTVEKGVIYVAEDGKNKFETAVKWDGEKSLNTYDAVWILPEKDDTDDSDYLLGDVNNDGTVDSTDYLRIKSHFLGTITLEGKEFKAGDVDSSGTIDSTDYLRIKSHFFGEYDLHK